MKTIYNPAYHRLIARIKAQRIDKHLTQVEAGRRVCMSRNWIAKIEICELRLDVLHFVRLCRAYKLKASNLIKDMEEEPSLDDFSLNIAYFDRLRLDFGGTVLLTLDNRLCLLWTFSSCFFHQTTY